MLINASKVHFKSCAAWLLCVVSSASFASGETTLVSVDSSGVIGNGYSVSPVLSATGRWVAFTSYANNLVAGDTNGIQDVFVHDRLSHKTTRVSVDSAGAQSHRRGFHSMFPSISANGRWVAFNSADKKLVADDTNVSDDIFIHDRLTHKTTRVSVNSTGQQGNGDSFGQGLSANGRWVVFNSAANNLVAGDANGYFDTFVHDRLTGDTSIVSVDSNGVPGGAAAYSIASISADGRWVAFESRYSNLVAEDTNGESDVFVHDRLNHETTRVSVDSDGMQGNSGSSEPQLSADGRWVTFTSYANNLVAGDTNEVRDIFVHDRLSHKTTRVSIGVGVGVGVDGEQGNGESFSSRISADGRRVAFTSWVANLVPGDTNGTYDVFIHDRLTHKTRLASRSTKGAIGNGSSFAPSLNADGRVLAFYSWSTNWVSGEYTVNSTNIFVHDSSLISSGRTVKP